MRSNPALSSIDLFDGFLDGRLEPASPSHAWINVGLVRHVFVTENDKVIAKDDQQVANLLAIAAASLFLIAVDAEIAPETQEGVLGEEHEVPFRGIDAGTTPNCAGTWLQLRGRVLVALLRVLQFVNQDSMRDWHERA
ncbi:MAG: hypothetical protein ACREM3_24880 [Candidatus Rokuibacteriota bacterium]